MAVMVPVSWGELIDKITILEIKQARIDDAAKRANVTRELDALSAVRDGHGVLPDGLDALHRRLVEINTALWEIEDDIRDRERRQDFGADFIRLARAVYFTNDDRSRVKRQVNDLMGSELVEEKSYADYTAG